MLHIPQKDIEWYTRRPGYYEMVQENLKKLNDTLGDIDMTEDQEKTWVWLAGNEARTIDNIKQDQKELYEGGKKNTESRNNNA